ncbi:hypothetical protein SAMN05421595_0424 [Austwickia chelonae]|uniref:Uncharacterized protein n=2 Tax=Austwickia TaxID=1184606 RepID=K6V6Q6_9MICO|nr:hypothetical protein AUCHE_08_01560 [Austwickia chelonae NBRC 105200]SEV92113.1 hypothetical protein SAMN05421595_0424 [Austwickia chelonae]
MPVPNWTTGVLPRSGWHDMGAPACVDDHVHPLNDSRTAMPDNRTAEALSCAPSGKEARP